jgi:two-component system LytT family response regulator
MTYRRDVLDAPAVVRQSPPNDPRRDLSPRIGSLAHPPRPERAVEQPPAPLADVAASPGATPEVILVKTGFRQVATRVREILHIESARNYVRIYLETGAVLKSRVQMERLAEHLGTERFVRIHRGRLVNRERIRYVRPIPGGRLQVTLSNGSIIFVARDRRRSVLAAIGTSAERAR